MNHAQSHISPLTVRGNPTTNLIEVQLGRDMVITYRGMYLVLLEVNGLQYAPISMEQHHHEDWFKPLVKGGLDPILRDAPVIEKMVLDYLFDAAIKTRMGESDAPA